MQRIAADIVQVRLPLPFALNHVNCYLLAGPEGWTLVDAGLNTPEARAAWDSALAELGIGWDDVAQVVLTHMHPDHFGLAGWVQQRTGLPVALSPVEQEQARLMWQENGWRAAAVAEYWRQGGMTGDVAGAISAQTARLRTMTLPHPTSYLSILPGEEVRLGARTFRTLHAPGHSDGQLLFYDPADRLLLCGDHVLLSITPNIGLWPSSEADPLGRYLVSLAELQSLDVRLALPGHGRSITDWPGRLAELQAHHAERLAAMQEAVGSGATALEVSRRVFDFTKFSQHEVRFAVAETLAHLEYLARRGRLFAADNGARIYRPA